MAIERATTNSSEHGDKKFTVAICGGGIAGLVLAIALQEFSAGDIRVNVYESAKKFTEIGAGVGLYKRPWKVMKRLGLKESLGKLTKVPESEDKPRVAFQLRKSDQAKGFQFYTLPVPMGVLTFHRAEYLQALASRLDPAIATSHFSKRLVSYTQRTSITDSVALHFNDGTTATCDVLIGADGIHSATRHCLLKEAANAIATSDAEQAELLLGKVDPMWSGSIAYRAVFASEKLRCINPEHHVLNERQSYTGKNKHLIVFPISYDSEELINVVAFCSRPEEEGAVAEENIIHDCDKDEVRAQYVGWEPEVQQIIECMDNPTKWSINAVRELPISVHGRVALLGDAAHAMTPHQGSGAGQAVEDAFVLAGLLAHAKTTRSTLPEALKVYEAVRLPHANDVQRRSRRNGRLFELMTEELGSVPDPVPSLDSEEDENVAKLRQFGDAITENWEWAWKTDVDDDLERALRMLEERVI